MDELLVRAEAPPEGLVVNFDTEEVCRDEKGRPVSDQRVAPAKLAGGKEEPGRRSGGSIRRILSAEKGLHFLLLC